jgi:bacterial leucyl aminopeptidase
VNAVLQLDMTGYVHNNQTKIGVTKDQFSDLKLAEFTVKLVEEYTTRGHVIIACSHGCSDHASWTRAKYRAVYTPSRNSPQGLNPNAHRVTDTKEKLDYVRMKDFVKVALGFAVELST